jgi:hypothetical protein
MRRPYHEQLPLSPSEARHPRAAELIEMSRVLDANTVRRDRKIATVRSKSRPERHFVDSFISMKLALARAIACWLPRCPVCHRSRAAPTHDHSGGAASGLPTADLSQ